MITLHLKEKGRRVENKTLITRDEFKSVTMMFAVNRDYSTLGRITYSKFDELIQQHQRTVGNWSGGLVVSGGSLNPDKGY